MTRIRLLCTFAILCGVLSTVAVQKGMAQEKKGPAVQEPAKTDKQSPDAKYLHDLELAFKLIQYGRQNKNAESLLIAAQIIHKTPTRKLKAEFKVTGEGKETTPVPTKIDNSPKALIAEAKKLSSSVVVENLAMVTQKMIDEETRGPAGGPMASGFFIVQPNRSFTYDPIQFVGLQRAIVHVEMLNGLADSQMVLEVFDQFGTRVAMDNIPGNYFRTEFTPAFNHRFTIRLTNRDSIPYTVRIRAN
jgi:hypothetical protein